MAKTIRRGGGPEAEERKRVSAQRSLQGLNTASSRTFPSPPLLLRPVGRLIAALLKNKWITSKRENATQEENLIAWCDSARCYQFQ